MEAELERLQKAEIITPIEWSEWATPIVVVLKPDGAIRLCGDYKTVNPALKIDKYPLPKIEDIFASLGGSTVSSKIDLKQAYSQMELDDEAKKLLTINAQKGLYQYNRLAFGIASAPAMWQRTMDQILQGIPKSQCLLDDIVVAGRDEDEHFNILNQVLECLDKNNLTINPKKCAFFQESITFCGHQIDKEGLHKTLDKIQAVREAPRPCKVTELRSFLGLVNYYNRFLPNLSTKLTPLYALLQKHTTWKWSTKCQEAFEEVKALITSEQVLTHFNPELPLTLACDASPYGLGAVLSHTISKGVARPIAFASRTLIATEQKYAQIDKEGTALIWGIKHFHQCLYGKRFTLITDHQPLTAIFNPEKGVSTTTAARLQRYGVFLSGYSFNICTVMQTHCLAYLRTVKTWVQQRRSETASNSAN